MPEDTGVIDFLLFDSIDLYMKLILLVILRVHTTKNYLLLFFNYEYLKPKTWAYIILIILHEGV